MHIFCSWVWVTESIHQKKSLLYHLPKNWRRRKTTKTEKKNQFWNSFGLVNTFCGPLPPAFCFKNSRKFRIQWSSSKLVIELFSSPSLYFFKEARVSVRSDWFNGKHMHAGSYWLLRKVKPIVRATDMNTVVGTRRRFWKPFLDTWMKINKYHKFIVAAN